MSQIATDPVRYGFKFLLLHHIRLIPVPNDRSQIVEAQNCSTKACSHGARTPSSSSWLYDWSTHSSSLVLCTIRGNFLFGDPTAERSCQDWPRPLCVTSSYTGFYLLQCAVNFIVGEYACWRTGLLVNPRDSSAAALFVCWHQCFNLDCRCSCVLVGLKRRMKCWTRS